MNVKERLEQLKAVVSKLESRTKKIILAGVGGLIVFHCDSPASEQKQWL